MPSNDLNALLEAEALLERSARAIVEDLRPILGAFKDVRAEGLWRAGDYVSFEDYVRRNAGPDGPIDADVVLAALHEPEDQLLNFVVRAILRHIDRENMAELPFTRDRRWL